MTCSRSRSRTASRSGPGGGSGCPGRTRDAALDLVLLDAPVAGDEDVPEPVVGQQVDDQGDCRPARRASVDGGRA